MNMFVMIAGVVAALTTIGHFLVGSRQYLKPMMNAEFDAIPKKVMHSIFHYSSVFLLISTVYLLLIGAGVIGAQGTAMLLFFIALNYLGFAIWLIKLALASGISKPLIKMFQWVFFIIIALCSVIGVFFPMS